MKKEIPDMNLFMVCEALNTTAISELPVGYHVRTCRRNELDIWKAMPFDDPKTADEYYDYMTSFFNDTYAIKNDLFYQKCLFVCDFNDMPIATCFAWKAYDKINTIHWLKVLKGYEGMGIGRALLSIIMKQLNECDYPVYLHTQPSSYRAIKLYSDFGFVLLSDPVIGYRENHVKKCLPILKEYMPVKDFLKLKITKAPEYFLETVCVSHISQF